MFKLSPAILLLICIPMLTHSQKTIQGKILDKATQEPIAYANIGVQRFNIGTISNPDGSFSIQIPGKLMNDTLIISCLGFEEKAIAIKFFTQEKDAVIYLDKKITELKTVIVSSKRKPRMFELGNAAVTGGVLETDTLYAGRSVALLIKKKDQKEAIFPAYIEKARLRIFRNNLSSFKFRIRLNEVDSLTGAPGKDLLQQSIVMESSIRKGWMVFDLSHLNIEVTKPFFITFEQILDFNDRAAIATGFREFLTRHPTWVKTDTVEFEGKKEVRNRFVRGGIDLPGTFLAVSSSKSAHQNHSCFVRETSFGDWKKVRGIVTATVLLSNGEVQ